MHAVEALRALVDVLALVGDRVVALVLVREILLDDLARHPRPLAGRLAAVEDAVEVEMDADAVGKGIRRIVRCRQRDPPDRREIGDDHQRRRQRRQRRDDQILPAAWYCRHCVNPRAGTLVPAAAGGRPAVQRRSAACDSLLVCPSQQSPPQDLRHRALRGQSRAPYCLAPGLLLLRRRRLRPCTCCPASPGWPDRPRWRRAGRCCTS
jgi:hypothetical protein